MRLRNLNSTASPVGESVPRRGRLKPLLLIGVLAVAVALGIRYSPWAQEYRLKRASLDSLRSWAVQSPRDPLVHYYLASQQFNNGLYPEALSGFEKAAALSPKMGRAHLGVAVVREKLGQMREAHAAAKRAAALEPKSAETQYYLGRLSYRISPAAGYEEFQKLTRLSPRRAEAWYWLGVSEADTQRFSAAVNSFRRAVALEPKNATFRRELGKALLDVDLHDEGRRELEQARALNPQDPATHYYLGRALLNTGRSNEELQAGEKEYQTAIELLRGTDMPPNQIAPIMADRAEALKRLRRPQEAMQVLKEARRLDPELTRLLFLEAELARLMGQQDRARELMRQYEKKNSLETAIFQMMERIKQDAKNPPLRLRMARLFAQDKDWARAVNQYQMCLYLDPKNETARKELAALLARLGKQGGKGAGTPGAAPAPANAPTP